MYITITNQLWDSAKLALFLRPSVFDDEISNLRRLFPKCKINPTSFYHIRNIVAPIFYVVEKSSLVVI